MNVLIGCEFSGVVREAFNKLGHNAWSCDIEDAADGSLHHIREDLLFVMGARNWDLMIAHPPCTYLTNAGVRHLHEHVTSRNGKRAGVFGKERWAEMEKAAMFFNTIKNSNIKRICVENPIPHRYAREIIGQYDQIIQPWQFGHGETKATCLWLKGLPKLQATNIVGDRYPRCHLQSPGIKNGLTRAQRRSITYQGIADAMAAQWGNLK